IFHLYTHAFFKALLFLGSGAVIHALAGEQDLRNMGGLRKDLPITYWTFLIGALAIAGVPLLSGFFSKDEILYRTFTATNSNRLLLWGIGMLTSLLTATYMFRLVFLAFHGSRRHDAPATAHPDEAAHGAHAGHGHGAGQHLHDAPASMAIPLIVLAIGSVLAGYVGVPHALGGSNRIEGYLEPSFEVTESARASRRGLEAEPVAAAPQAAEPTHGSGDAGGETSTELMLMALSSGIALAGIGLAAYFWLRNRPAADRMARSLSGVYGLLVNKYYVDEIYDAAVVQPIKLFSTGGLWKGMDVGVVDGAVNGVGMAVQTGSTGLRRLQTGSVRTYAAALFLGVVVILGFYLWR
ncbi:MAG: proton-conducting transporter membrane subunit, partial [Acidobacteriota bacterium]